MSGPTNFQITFAACVLWERAEYCRYVGHTFAVLPDGELTLVGLHTPDIATAEVLDAGIERCLDMLYTRGARIPEHLLA